MQYLMSLVELLRNPRSMFRCSCLLSETSRDARVHVQQKALVLGVSMRVILLESDCVSYLLPAVPRVTFQFGWQIICANLLLPDSPRTACA